MEHVLLVEDGKGLRIANSQYFSSDEVICITYTRRHVRRSAISWSSVVVFTRIFVVLYLPGTMMCSSPKHVCCQVGNGLSVSVHRQCATRLRYRSFWFT